MKKVDVADMETRMGPADVIRPLTDALGLADLAINYYELEPGDSFAYGVHAHANQEEVFYPVEGTVIFQTMDGDVEVTTGEAIRFGPGEFQRGVNRGDERVVALAIGAPQESGETTILRECPECGDRTGQDIAMTDDRDAIVTTCVECGTETGRFD